MKKFWALLSLISAIFIFVSCIEEDDPEDNFSSDTAPAETGDTTPANPADTTPTDPADTGDTDTAPADTTPADPTDTTPADTADTGDTDYTPAPTCSCAGKDCGDDGCGNPCGDYNGGCQPNFTCLANNTCQCTPSCEGKLCTDDNGCGYPCGCKSNEECNTNSGVCECVPSCEGKECGDDGCGGTCGECAGDETCTAAQICKGCTTVTLSPIATAKNANNYIHFNTTADAYTPNTGDTSKDDEYGFIFKSSAVNTGDVVDLSTSIDNCLGKDSTRNANFMCFFILEDHKASSEPKRFLPKTGTVTVNSFSSSGPKINAELKGIKMYEMVEEVHSALNKEYYFVPDGDCIIVEDTTLEYNK